MTGTVFSLFVLASLCTIVHGLLQPLQGEMWTYALHLREIDIQPISLLFKHFLS